MTTRHKLFRPSSFLFTMQKRLSTQLNVHWTSQCLSFCPPFSPYCTQILFLVPFAVPFRGECMPQLGNKRLRRNNVIVLLTILVFLVHKMLLPIVKSVFFCVCRFWVIRVFVYCGGFYWNETYLRVVLRGCFHDNLVVILWVWNSFVCFVVVARLRKR